MRLRSVLFIRLCKVVSSILTASIVFASWVSVRRSRSNFLLLPSPLVLLRRISSLAKPLNASLLFSADSPNPSRQVPSKRHTAGRWAGSTCFVSFDVASLFLSSTPIIATSTFRANSVPSYYLSYPKFVASRLESSAPARTK